MRHSASSRLHRCAYCGKPSYFKCLTCEANGLGLMSVCGPKASLQRGCRNKHMSGAPVKHGTFIMTSSESRKRIAIARRKRCMSSSSAPEDEDEEPAEDS